MSNHPDKFRVHQAILLRYIKPKQACNHQHCKGLLVNINMNRFQDAIMRDLFNPDSGNEMIRLTSLTLLTLLTLFTLLRLLLTTLFNCDPGNGMSRLISLTLLTLLTLFTLLRLLLTTLFNSNSGNGMSYVRIPVSLMSDFMPRDGGGLTYFYLFNLF